jgi:hypothetical protein
LRTFYNAAVYFLRELTLVNYLVPDNLNIEKYTAYARYVGNRTKYIRSLRSKIENIYVEAHNLTESLSSIDLPISENTSHFLEDNDVTFLFILNDLEIYEIQTTFAVSLVQLNSALYNLAISNSLIQQNTTDLPIFIRNYMSEVGERIIKQVEIYIYELELRNNNKIKIFIIGLVFILIILVILFVVLSISYKSIIRKKSSYIEGFYGIGKNFIRQSLKHCEQYIYFLKKQKKEDESGLKHTKNSEISHNNEEMDDIQENETKNYDNFSLNFKIEEKNLNIYRRNTINQNINKDSSSILNFSIMVFIYFLIIFGFYIYLCIAYINFMHKILKDSKFIFHLQRLQNNAIDIFNGYREFIFDENTMIYRQNSEAFIQNKLDDIFATKGTDTFYVYNEVINIGVDSENSYKYCENNKGNRNKRKNKTKGTR